MADPFDPGSSDPFSHSPGEVIGGRRDVLHIDPAAAGFHAGGPGLARGSEGEIIPPSSPTVAQAIKRVSAWMQERAQREPQPVLEKNIEIMLRGGPMAEGMAKHMLNTFQQHPSEALPPKVIEQEPAEAKKWDLVSDFRDYYRGDNYGSIYARDPEGNIIGQLDFAGNRSSVKIQNVEVHPGWRRQGVATDLVNELTKNQFPGAQLDWGMSTPEGTSFRGAYEQHHSAGSE